MNYGEIKYCDIANGAGVRTTLFVSGCTHHCPGCFQPQTWDFAYGKPFDDAVADRIVESLREGFVSGLTVLGGEPMEPENQRALLPFLQRVRSECAGKDVWVYTGDVYEDLANPESPRHTEATDALLSLIDVLVDGPFVQERKDITLRFRGSANQRIIDLAATRAAGEVREWRDDPLFATHALA